MEGAARIEENDFIQSRINRYNGDIILSEENRNLLIM